MAACLLLFLLFQDPATLAREDVKKGLELSQKGDLRAANVYFETALKLDPNDVEAAYYLSVNQYRLGQFSPAKANLERILKAKPEMKRATVLLGVVLERLNDDRGAIRLLESAADLVRRQPEAVAAMKTAIELEPAAEINFGHLAQILVEAGRYADAGAAAEKALAVAPKSSAAYLLRGRAEAGIGNFNLAVRSYARAVELNPADAAALLNLAL